MDFLEGNFFSSGPRWCFILFLSSPAVERTRDRTSCREEGNCTLKGPVRDLAHSSIWKPIYSNLIPLTARRKDLQAATIGQGGRNLFRLILFSGLVGRSVGRSVSLELKYSPLVVNFSFSYAYFFYFILMILVEGVVDFEWLWIEGWRQKVQVATSSSFLISHPRVKNSLLQKGPANDLHITETALCFSNGNRRLCSRQSLVL